MKRITLRGNEIFTLLKKYNNKVLTDKIGRKYKKFIYDNKFTFTLYDTVVQEFEKKNIVEFTLLEIVSIKGNRIYSYGGHVTKGLSFLLDEHEKKIKEIRGSSIDNPAVRNSIKFLFGKEPPKTEDNKK